MGEGMLEGMPQSEPRPLSAGDLVAAWVDGWSGAHVGQPHPALLGRVRGVCKTLAKDCGSLEDWREGWRAAKRAGARGRFDVIGELGEPQTVTGRGNHYLAVARELDSDQQRRLGS